MTTVRWSPWGELAERPDILVHRCRLDGAQGWWCPQDRVILLDERLDRRAARCVLAHELGHVVLGHEGVQVFGDAPWLARRQEAEADRWAATRLIDARELGRALAARPADPGGVARSLRVTDRMLDVWWRCATPADRALVSALVAAAEHAA